MTMTQNSEQAEHFRTILDMDWFYWDRGWLDCSNGMGRTKVRLLWDRAGERPY